MTNIDDSDLSEDRAVSSLRKLSFGLVVQGSLVQGSSGCAGVQESCGAGVQGVRWCRGPRVLWCNGPGSCGAMVLEKIKSSQEAYCQLRADCSIVSNWLRL